MQRRRKATFCQYGSASVKLFFRTSGANPPPPFGHGAHRHCLSVIEIVAWLGLPILWPLPCCSVIVAVSVPSGTGSALENQGNRRHGLLRDRVANDARRCTRRRVSDADNFIPVARPGGSALWRIDLSAAVQIAAIVAAAKLPRQSTIVRQSLRGGSPRAGQLFGIG